MISGKLKSWVLSVNVDSCNSILCKCRIAYCSIPNSKGKLSRSNNFVNKERSVKLSALETFGEDNFILNEVMRTVRCAINQISPHVSSAEDIFLKTCSDLDFLD